MRREKSVARLTQNVMHHNMKIHITSNTYTTTEGMTPQYDFTIGRSYGVIQIDIFPGQNKDECIYFRVVDDDGEVAYVPIILCTITPSEVYLNGKIKNELPEGWTTEEENGNISLLPVEFSKKEYKARHSFWEDFYDAEGNAEHLVGIVLKRLYPKAYEQYEN